MYKSNFMNIHVELHVHTPQNSIAALIEAAAAIEAEKEAVPEEEPVQGVERDPVPGKG
jgi:hypothetical protein